MANEKGVYKNISNILLFLIISLGLSLSGFAGEGPLDTDGDGFTDDIDNCVQTPNADQIDTDGDGIGSACDSDEAPPVTTKTYGEPNVPAQLQVPTCDGSVNVNGHIISTQTQVTLNAVDEERGSGVALTSYLILVPTDCNQGEIQYVGLIDHEIYQTNESCTLAVDNQETEENETQECVATYWNSQSEQPLTYVSPFIIEEESIHKICFASIDREEHEEEVQCQVVGVDDTPPVTRKTYGEPNEEGQIKVPSCEGDVLVNGHFITTGATITLDAVDPEPHASGVDSTNYAVLVPLTCEEADEQDFDETEYVGLQDNNIYEGSEDGYDSCRNAVEGGQRCAATYWRLKTELLEEGQEYPLTYRSPFVIPQESTHKICFYSVDNVGNQEEQHCQVVLVDDNAPVINSIEVDHDMIDLEDYQGGVYNNNHFDDPKCAVISVNASDTHDIDEVQVEVHDALLGMFYPQLTELSSFNEKAWEKYQEDDMHHMPAATLNKETGLYEYTFCPGGHIYHLYNTEYEYETGEGTESDSVIDSDDARKLVSEKLVLGEVELHIVVNDTTGKETETEEPIKITIVDLTVPLEVGWNLRSTPSRLEGNKFWTAEGVDAVLRWDSETQSWELVTDNSIEPLNALYMHATNRNQYGEIFERDLTSPPVRQLHKQWNLVGLALQQNDNLVNPCSSDSHWSYCHDDSEYYDEEGDGDGYHCSYDYYDHDGPYRYYYGPGENDWYWEYYYHLGDYLKDEEICSDQLTNLHDNNYYSCVGDDALDPIVLDPSGNNALEVVISPTQYLSYSDDGNQWYFNQDSWVWLPESGNEDEEDNGCDQYVQNFGGYWLFMQNEDDLPGFTTTPLQVSWSD